MYLLKLCIITLPHLCVQQPAPLPALAATNAYVRRIDADKSFISKWYVHTHHHTYQSGVDSLFLVYTTDFEGTSVAVYFSGSKIVKLVETARTASFFTENSYYLQNNKLLFVKNRQVHCPFFTQRAAWDRKISPCTKETDYFFRGAYYFAQDSCINKWERGKSEWKPEYSIPGGGGRWVTVPEIFPYKRPATWRFSAKLRLAKSSALHQPRRLG